MLISRRQAAALICTVVSFLSMPGTSAAQFQNGSPSGIATGGVMPGVGLHTNYNQMVGLPNQFSVPNNQALSALNAARLNPYGVNPFNPLNPAIPGPFGPFGPFGVNPLAPVNPFNPFGINGFPANPLQPLGVF